jgi:hypothetical protein
LELLERHRTEIEQLAKWAPQNFAHMKALVDAEQARVNGDFENTVKFYERTILLAQENKAPHFEAMANEMAAKFFLSLGAPTGGGGYIKNAYRAYKHWGAAAKVEQMEEHTSHIWPALREITRTRSKTGAQIIKTAIADGFDVASMKRMPKNETPHAFGFVFRQIMNDKVIPTVPVVLNTFYPPNQPTVSRCYDFGKSIVRAIKEWDSPARVALIASGGLTHFVIDEEVDNLFLDAVRKGKIEDLAALGEPIFQAGTSEIKNWVPVAGGMAALGFEPTIVDFVPCYRSLAGTGNAMGFAYWRAA